jgi:hypothetical protein
MQRQTTTKNKPESITSPPLSRVILQRKCACGNQSAGGECAECSKKKGFLQRRAVRISDPSDRYEQEADRIADQVMRMPEPTAKHQVGSEKEGVLQRKAIATQITSLVYRQDFSNIVQPKETTNQADPLNPDQKPSEVPSIVYEVLNSPGQPLNSQTRAFFEPRFGRDFSQVRVHTDDRAAASAQAVNAYAYTIGNNIVFAKGQYKLATEEKRRLLAHELTHVVQQDVDDTLIDTSIALDDVYGKTGEPLVLHRQEVK